MSSRIIRVLLLVFGVALAGSAAAPREAAAQSDILLRLRSGSPAGDRFRVDSASGTVSIGQLGIGIIPASGAGYRMMWHPFKAAFRVGGVDGTQWDDANIGFYSWAGGNGTKASAFATFAFGDGTTVSGVDAAGFGSSNTVSGTAGFSTGASNRCTGFGCVAMGFTNTASGQGSVAIGYRVTADADYAVSLGHRASSNGFSGTFNFGDESTTDSIQASANNQVNFRGAGGFRFRTNATLTTGCNLPAGSGVFSCSSSRNLKENFRRIDGEDILVKLRSVPVTQWNYISEGQKVSHIGPMAQDWWNAFRIGTDNESIGLLDANGVAIAAAQALDKRTENLVAEIKARDAKIADLEARLARIEALLESKK
jgi:hypothetical protein